MSPRNFSEPWDPEDIFDRQEAAERRAKMQARREHNAAMAALEDAENEKRREAARQFTLETNRGVLLGQYRQAGVDPLHLDENGAPTVSLPLLLSMGWKVVSFDGERYLVGPNRESTRPGAGGEASW